MGNMVIKMPAYWREMEPFKDRPVNQVEIEIPAYSRSYGVIPASSDEDYILDVQIEASSQEVMITGDKEGLIMLARHLLTLAQDEVPAGCHIHYDEFNGMLDKGSLPMVIGKI
ncbi:Imm32 family immunity protein [Ktedonobacter racemifer]|uniref:Uncharacterized protein n=1 Tax=Ktedonobacter racemifer DSM 44963 TaxID=485913 RepID=D6TV29_KTERA|nr:hypothetical protein [Ktedonobacter racemifer]EFH84129.1 hypothetical protein Krac_5149 [Ktedonobacter racemifer DSM 44963]